MRGGRIAADGHGNARTLLRRSGLVLVLALGLVLAGLAATAFAAVTGVGTHAVFSNENSSNKSVTSTCPAGKRVIGAGGQVLDFSSATVGQLVLGIIRPDPTLTSVTTQGREDQTGTPDDWLVRADAVCAPAPPGLQRVAAISPSNSTNKSVTATCPTGKRLLGFGAEVDGGRGQVAPNDVIPGSGLKSVTVTALEDEDGTPVNWRARAYAICAVPVAGLERIAAASATDSEDKVVSKACPAGKQLLSAGAELAGGRGEVVINELVADASPSPNAADVFAAEDEDGTTANWSARVFAICAAKSQRVVQDGGFTAPFVDAFCPTGMRLTGPGADLTDANGQVLITAIVPAGTGGTHVAVVPDFEAVNPSNFWFARAYAICAAPLPGLQVVQVMSATDSISSKDASAGCPAGKRVVGAGGSVDGGGEKVTLGAVVADPALASVTASGLEDVSGTPANWRVTAFAVCADPPPGLELVSATTDLDSDAKGITAGCPSTKNLLGAGASVADAGGRVVLDDVRPSADLTRTTATAFEDEFNFTAPWTLTAQAICANP